MPYTHCSSCGEAIIILGEGRGKKGGLTLLNMIKSCFYGTRITSQLESPVKAILIVNLEAWRVRLGVLATTLAELKLVQNLDDG